MPDVEPTADDCTHCTACTDYVTWLEGQLMLAVDSYAGLADVLAHTAPLAQTTAELAGLLGQARERVQERRLGQIEQQLAEGDDTPS